MLRDPDELTLEHIKERVEAKMELCQNVSQPVMADTDCDVHCPTLGNKH